MIMPLQHDLAPPSMQTPTTPNAWGFTFPLYAIHHSFETGRFSPPAKAILDFPVYCSSQARYRTMEGGTSLPPVATGPKIGYESGTALMAEGPEVLHALMASKIEAAMGRAMPQMEVRFSNLSVTADIVVAEDDGSKHELPTIPNELMKTFMGPKKHTVRKEILKNVTGVFTPGKITLLLGQPGSGKSALLKMLSGRFPMSKNITVEGDVSFNN
ncbi:hypothetical protein BBJ28_00025803, partial [Nothophytophthora sp. Chile5]